MTALSNWKKSWAFYYFPQKPGRIIWKGKSITHSIVPGKEWLFYLKIKQSPYFTHFFNSNYEFSGNCFLHSTSNNPQPKVYLTTDYSWYHFQLLTPNPAKMPTKVIPNRHKLAKCHNWAQQLAEWKYKIIYHVSISCAPQLVILWRTNSKMTTLYSPQSCTILKHCTWSRHADLQSFQQIKYCNKSNNSKHNKKEEDKHHKSNPQLHH